MTITATDLAPTVSPWRNRNFCLVWGGGLVNDIGDWLLRVALPVYVFTTTGSGTVTALVFLIEVVVAAVVGPFGGGLADRCDLRRVLIATNLVQAVTLLPLLAVRSGRIWPAFIVAAVQSALTACNDPAKVALLPRLVRADQLTVANAANSTSASLARLIGAPIGGLAVGLGGLGAVVAIDGLSFLFVAGMTVLVRAQTAPIAPAAPASPEPGGEVRRGLRLVRQHPPLPALVGIFGIAAVAQGLFVVLFVVFVVDALGGGGTQVGVIRGMMAVGAMVGAVLVARLGRHVDPMVLLAVGLAGLGGVSLVFWNAPAVTTTLGVYVLLFALSGIPGAALQVGLFTTMQQRSPPEVLGRLAGLVGAAEAVGLGVGSIAAGLLVDRLDLHLLLDVQATIYLVCGALVYRTVSSERRRRRLGASVVTPRASSPA